MSRLDYVEYKERVKGFDFQDYDSHHFHYVIQKLEEIVNPDEIQVFYPKKVFSNDNETELYIFTSDTLYIVSGKRYTISMKALKYKEIREIEFEMSQEGNAYATLKLHVGDTYFYLHSEEDSNESWSSTFAEKMKNIVKLF